nr:reverse transcriptase domain-containing protein [Tanacetum cinerariifolium]
MANTTPIVTTVTKTATKEKTPNVAKTAFRINILDFCEEHYEDILPVMDKIRRDNRKEVHIRLDFEEDSGKSQRMKEDSQNLSAKTMSPRYRHRRKSAFKRLSDTYSLSTTKSGPDREYSRDDSYSRGHPHQQNSFPNRDCPRSKDRSHSIEESYGNTYSSYRTGDKHRNQPKDGRGSNKFTPLTKTPKEIFVAESGKFKPPPPMVTPVEKRSSNKFCEFHNDKGHSTDECVQLRNLIEELVRAGKLS